MDFDSVFKMKADRCLSFCYRKQDKRGVLFGNITLIFCFENHQFGLLCLKNISFLLLEIAENYRKVEKYEENMQKVEENKVSIAFC